MLRVFERIQVEAKSVANVSYPRADELPAIKASLQPGDVLVLFGLTNPDVIALVVTRDDALIVNLGRSEDVEAACGVVGLGHS